MIIVRGKEELKNQINDWKKEGSSIGFVPTMGFLHKGHLSLVSNSKARADKTVLSIFVNPTQFNDPKDFLNYPMDEDGDLEKCRSAHVDLVFLPSKETIYPDKNGNLILSQPELERNLCGKTRPGHFSGVMLVVAKLFHLVRPDLAFFGLKDYQQFRILEGMVRILDFPIQMIGVETSREDDGLAMSSRNVKLGEKNRETAKLIPRMFLLADKILSDGETDLSTFKEILSDFLLSGTNLRIDYLETVDPRTLQEISILKGEFLLAIAAFIGETRLIDNHIFSVKSR